MIQQSALGSTRFAQLRVVVRLVRSGQLTLGGHRPGKIYGRLDCRAGKRMKFENRVFFRDEAAAIEQGYRPCAVCLPIDYRAWRDAL